MSKILFVAAREIFDSRGTPTVEVDVGTSIGQFRASVPSADSPNTNKVTEVRDGDKKRVMGKGVLKAVENIKEMLAPQLIGMDVTDQAAIDKLMVERCDGSKDEWGWCKSNVGANAILAVSMAVCRAGAAAKSLRLFQHVASLAGKPEDEFVLPVPVFPLLAGGVTAGNRLACKEIMIVPLGASTFREAMRVGTEVYHQLKTVLKKKYGQDTCNVVDEGGFAPPVDNDEALDVLMQAVNDAGHADKVKLAVDMAASEFYIGATMTRPGSYDLDFKNRNGSDPGMKKSSAGVMKYYKTWLDKYPVISVEDPFDNDDEAAYVDFTNEVGNETQIVGDQVLQTNPRRVMHAIKNKFCNSLLLKLTQIGTVTEAIEVAKLATDAGWGLQVANRLGETEDSFIADFAVGLRCGQIKTGAPCRSERIVKYNQLLRIEEELQEAGMGRYAGKDFRRP